MTFAMASKGNVMDAIQWAMQKSERLEKQKLSCHACKYLEICPICCPVPATARTSITPAASPALQLLPQPRMKPLAFQPSQ
jgi:radical SAM protein with 4Fe4S-binding SPASM domain